MNDACEMCKTSFPPKEDTGNAGISRLNIKPAKFTYFGIVLCAKCFPIALRRVMGIEDKK